MFLYLFANIAYAINIYPVEGEMYFQPSSNQDLSNGPFSVLAPLKEVQYTNQIQYDSIVDLSPQTVADDIQTGEIGILYKSTQEYIIYTGSIQYTVNFTISYSQYTCYNILYSTDIYLTCANQDQELVIVTSNSATVYQNISLENFELLQLYFLNGQLYLAITNTNSVLYQLGQPSIIYWQNNYQYSQIEISNDLTISALNSTVFLNGNNVLINTFNDDFLSYSIFKNVIVITTKTQFIILTDGIISSYTNDYYGELVFNNQDYIVILGNSMTTYNYQGKLLANANVGTLTSQNTFFLTFSNILGSFQINSLSMIQITEPAIYCLNPAGNGTFSQDQIVYNYFTVSQQDNSIYPVYDSYNQSINYPFLYMFPIDFAGSNVSLSLINSNITNYFYNQLFKYNWVSSLQSKEFYSGFPYFLDQLQLYLNVLTSEDLLFQLIMVEESLSQYIPIIEEQYDWGVTNIPSVHFLNKYNYVLVYISVNQESCIYNYSLASLRSTLIANISIGDNIITTILRDEVLLILTANNLLGYQQSTQLFNISANARNMYSSSDYDCIFVDLITNLTIIQIAQNGQYAIINTIQYGYSASAIQIGLLQQGIFLALFNESGSILQYYDRSIIFQYLLIPCQTFTLISNFSNLSGFTSKFFYIMTTSNQLAIYQSTPSSLNTLYASVYLSYGTLTQFSCTTNYLMKVDLCDLVWSDKLENMLVITHQPIDVVQSYFTWSTQTQIQYQIQLSNAQAEYTLDVNIDSFNNQLQINQNTVESTYVINNTNGSLSLNELFEGLVQNYSIECQNCTYQFTPPITTQFLNFSVSQECASYTEIDGVYYLLSINYLFKAFANNSVITIQHNDAMSNFGLFNYQNLPYWIQGNGSIAYLCWYNLTIQQTLLQNIYLPTYAHSQNNIIQIVSNYDSQFQYQALYLDSLQMIVQVNIYGKVISSMMNTFYVNESFFGLLMESLPAALTLLVCNSSVVKQYPINLKEDSNIVGQVYSITQISAQPLRMAITTGISAEAFTINFENEGVTINNTYYYYTLNNTGFQSTTPVIAASGNLVAMISGYNVYDNQTLVSVYQDVSGFNIPDDYQVQIIGYLNYTLLFRESPHLPAIINSQIFVAYNTQVFVYPINNQLTLNYQTTANQSTIEITAYNLMYNSTKLIQLNQYVPPPIPTPPPPTPSENTFDYWILIWVAIGILVAALITIIGYCVVKKLKSNDTDGREIEFNLNKDFDYKL